MSMAPSVARQDMGHTHLVHVLECGIVVASSIPTLTSCMQISPMELRTFRDGHVKDLEPHVNGYNASAMSIDMRLKIFDMTIAARS